MKWLTLAKLDLGQSTENARDARLYCVFFIQAEWQSCAPLILAFPYRLVGKGFVIREIMAEG